MIKTFRAKSIQEALQLVRMELGPDASVLHTRRLNSGMIGRLVRGKQVEVAATAGATTSEATITRAAVAAPVDAPPSDGRPSDGPLSSAAPAVSAAVPSADTPTAANDYRQRYQQELRAEGIDLAAPSQLEPPPESASEAKPVEAPTALFDAFTMLIEAEVDEPVCRDLLHELRAAGAELRCPDGTRRRLARLVASQMKASGPIAIDAAAERCAPRVAALVGPTGVGKTTTLAKLAANFRLRQKLSVGLITVDTYRVAAVEQLRTYADIIDLPMEVVTTPREMRSAMERFAGLDLVLMDTAGRSPRDTVKVQELRAVLDEARPDEVHLVLSTTAGSRSLVTTAERFSGVGVTSVLLTKLDEATGLGHVLTLTRETGLPISYVTNGQNVPKDIAVADADLLASAMLADPAGEGLI